MSLEYAGRTLSFTITFIFNSCRHFLFHLVLFICTIIKFDFLSTCLIQELSGMFGGVLEQQTSWVETTITMIDGFNIKFSPLTESGWFALCRIRCCVHQAHLIALLRVKGQASIGCHSCPFNGKTLQLSMHNIVHMEISLDKILPSQQLLFANAVYSGRHIYQQVYSWWNFLYTVYIVWCTTIISLIAVQWYHTLRVGW